MTIVLSGGSETLDAQFAFHLHAGVDLVLAADPGSHETSETLDRYERVGLLHRVPASAGTDHTELARLAVTEHDADWVIPSAAGEFWWPRGESLADVLAVIPPRYAVVQGLVRSFAGPREGSFFAEEMTARTSLLASGGSAGDPPQRLLRPIYRAAPDLVIDRDDWTLGGRRVPLRAWYPLEVLTFPEHTAVDVERLDELVADGVFVVDTRLRDALRNLRGATEDAHTESFPLPAEGASRLTFAVPTIVDDASYAVECAAVGEVDLVRLDQHIRELERRIAALEARLWPRFRRAARRLARRPS